MTDNDRDASTDGKAALDVAREDDVVTAKEAQKMVPLRALFRFYKPLDVALLVTGMLFAALG